MEGRQRLGGAGDERQPAAADGEREAAEPDRSSAPRGSDSRTWSPSRGRTRLGCRSAAPSAPGSTRTGPTPPAGRTPATYRRADGATGPRDADGRLRLRHQLLRRHHIVANRGLLSSDQALLLSDPTTAAQVVGYTNSSPETFQADFAAAMVKMGAAGSIRRTNCGWQTEWAHLNWTYVSGRVIKRVRTM